MIESRAASMPLSCGMSEDDRLRWNGKHAARVGDDLSPEPFLLECLHELARRGLPRDPTALDVACGTGRHARALAERGFDVTAVDVSDVAVERVASMGPRIHAQRQ